jgi:hypothetical protein
MLRSSSPAGRAYRLGDLGDTSLLTSAVYPDDLLMAGPDMVWPDMAQSGTTRPWSALGGGRGELLALGATTRSSKGYVVTRAIGAQDQP